MLYSRTVTNSTVVGPFLGYQPRRKQVVEVRKLFEGYQVGEISLFYELEFKPPSPGEELFEEYVFRSGNTADIRLLTDID